MLSPFEKFILALIRVVAMLTGAIAIAILLSLRL